jgi:hypothetical protein
MEQKVETLERQKNGGRKIWRMDCSSSLCPDSRATSPKPFTRLARFVRLRRMRKKLLPLLFVPLLFAGCTATFTNLTPTTQVRNKDNLYPVEVAFNTRQQSLRWDAVHPRIQVGDKYYDMRPTLMMTNRFEGAIPVPPSTDAVRYRYKFDFKYNDFGAPMADSAISPEYTLRITEGK